MRKIYTAFRGNSGNPFWGGSKLFNLGFPANLKGFFKAKALALTVVPVLLCALIISSDTNAQAGVYESNLALNTRTLSNYYSKLRSDRIKPALVNAPLAVTETHVDVACHGAATGSIDISVSDGTAPYSYSWSNGAISEDQSGLVAGTYTVTVTDAVGKPYHWK